MSKPASAAVCCARISYYPWLINVPGLAGVVYPVPLMFDESFVAETTNPDAAIIRSPLTVTLVIYSGIFQNIAMRLIITSEHGHRATAGTGATAAAGICQGCICWQIIKCQNRFFTCQSVVTGKGRDGIHGRLPMTQ